MTPSLANLEDEMIELMREGRARGETPRFTALKAVQRVVPSADQPELLASVYMDCPYTIDQVTDDGGCVSELLHNNLRTHLMDWAKHWTDVMDKHDTSKTVVYLKDLPEGKD